MKLARVGTLAALVAVALVARALLRGAADMPPLGASLPSLVLVGVLGLAANVAAMAVASRAWRGALVGAGSTLSATDAFVICGRAQIGKYLPGNVFHLVGRAGLAHARGIAVPLVTASLVVETCCIIAAAGVLGLPVALWRVSNLDALPHPGITSAVVVIAVLLVAGAAWVLARDRIRAMWAGARQVATPATIGRMLAYDVVTFAMLGAWLWFAGTTLWPGQVVLSPWECGSAFALAWVIGFVTPGAPGGVGIREAVFMAVLGSGPQALAVATWLALVGRLQSVAGDLVTFSVASAIGARARRRSRP